MVILIFGGGDDVHAAHMHHVLKEKGKDVELFDSQWFPSHMQLSYDPARQSGSIRFPGGRLVPFDQLQSIYWRCYNNVGTPQLADAGQSYIASNDARSLFESLLIRLPCRWVNGWNAFQLHQTKPAQLAMVAALGMPVPETILSNDAEAIRAFAARVPKSIFKPVQGGAHTQRVTPTHLTDENLASLAYAPVTLQEEVPGTNIRVFVAGERVLTCEVRTEAIDFRDDDNPTITPHDLPPEVADQCLRAARALDLVWSGIDLRRTPEGRYIFLEANPSPMFIGFEQRSGLPLTESLAALLV